MPLPVTIPNTFANATSSIPLSQLDTNFSTLANAVNDINSGATTLANLKSSNVTITGGIISNVTLDNVTVQTESFDNVTMSNVTVTSGNVTVTNLTASGTVNFNGATVSNGGSVTTVDINGGTIDGVTIGGASAGAGTFTSLTDSGNLTFTGTGNRITGDFSNATVANRVAFQTSTTNSETDLVLLPNGTNTTSRAQLYTTNDGLNSSVLSLNINSAGSLSSIQSSITGTGTYLPMAFFTGGSERMRIDTDGNVEIKGNATNGGTLRLYEDTDNGTNYVALQAPASVASDKTITLPDATTTMVGTDATQTLTNKRVTPRVSTTTSSATPTINTDNTDIFGLTAQAVDITSFTTNLSGTPTDGQKLQIYIVGTAARAITWGASFESSTVTLPTTTVSTNRLDVGFVWNAATSKWRCLASA